MNYRIVSDTSNHNLPIGAHVTKIAREDLPEAWMKHQAVDFYTQGIVGDEVAIDSQDLVEVGWETIFTVQAALDPRDRGAVYRLVFKDGTTFELGDADDRYHELAHIIDSTAEEA